MSPMDRTFYYLFVKTCLMYQQDKIEHQAIVLLEALTFFGEALGEYLHRLHHMPTKLRWVLYDGSNRSIQQECGVHERIRKVYSYGHNLTILRACGKVMRHSKG